MKICVIIPVHNESAAIGSVVQAVKDLKFDVLVIDDGSADQSGEIAQKNGAMVITNKEKSGKGYSLQKGFDFAIDKKYDAVIAMDGDGQHSAEDIALFIAQAEKDPKSVISGNRMLNVKDMPWLRRQTNRAMSWIISKICHQEIPDTQCGYRYIHCEILKSIRLTCRDFEIETEVLIKAAKAKFRIYSVPIKTIYQDEESKIHPVKDTIRFFRYLLKELSS